MTFLGWLSDPFKGLSDLQLGDEKGTLNHLAINFHCLATKVIVKALERSDSSSATWQTKWSVKGEKVDDSTTPNKQTAMKIQSELQFSWKNPKKKWGSLKFVDVFVKHFLRSVTVRKVGIVDYVSHEPPNPFHSRKNCLALACAFTQLGMTKDLAIIVAMANFCWAETNQVE